MSKKSFIITALLINLTICITLSVVVLTDKKDNKAGNNANYENNEQSEIEKDSNQEIQEELHNSEVKVFDDNNMDEIGESPVQTNDKLPESETTTEEEKQVSVEATQPTTVNRNQEDETTESGSTAYVVQSKRIRTDKSTSSDTLGYTTVGATYRIEPSKSDANWVAIYLDENTLAYVASNSVVIN